MKIFGEKPPKALFGINRIKKFLSLVKAQGQKNGLWAAN